MSSYSQYRGRSIGRIIHFLHHYCDYFTAAHACIGGGAVTLGEDTIATFEWETGFGRGDVPVFRFAPGCESFDDAQRRKREVAALDGCALTTPPVIKPVDAEILLALLPEALRNAQLHAALVHNDAVASFFVSNEKLFAEMPGELYAWDKECGWLLWWVANRYEAMEKARLQQ